MANLTIDATLARHLAVGGSTTTLCGLNREGLTTVHPSKAKKDDCPSCREAFKLAKKAKAVAEPIDTVLLEKTVEDAIKELPADVAVDAIKTLARIHTELEARALVLGEALTLPEVKPDLVELTDLVPGTSDPTTAIAGEVTLAKPTVKKVRKAPTGGPVRWKPTVAEVAKVKALRADGMGLEDIDETMGWKPSHGNRPWKIIHGKLLAADE